jgi:hypothetical protein
VCLQLGSLVVGLPVVTLEFPETVTAWLRLRQFTHSSFELPEMVRVEAGVAATLLLVIILQVTTPPPSCSLMQLPWHWSIG